MAGITCSNKFKKTALALTIAFCLIISTLHWTISLQFSGRLRQTWNQELSNDVAIKITRVSGVVPLTTDGIPHLPGASDVFLPTTTSFLMPSTDFPEASASTAKAFLKVDVSRVSIKDGVDARSEGLASKAEEDRVEQASADYVIAVATKPLMPKPPKTSGGKVTMKGKLTNIGDGDCHISKQTTHRGIVLENWVPDWYNNSDNAEDLEAMLVKRRKDIVERCNNIQGYNQTHGTPWYRSKTVHLCPTCKGGSTFWNDFIKQQRANDTTVPGKARKKVKLTVSRNPWHRLVSCWQDRFSFTRTVARVHHSMKSFCFGKTWMELPPFSEFIQHCVIAHWKKHVKPNRHWSPVMDTCLPCRIHYDYFVAQENMNSEAAHILSKHAGFDDGIGDTFSGILDKVLRPGEKLKCSTNYQDHYKDVSDEHMEILRELYKYDIMLFNYPNSPYVDFPHA